MLQALCLLFAPPAAGSIDIAVPPPVVTSGEVPPHRLEPVSPRVVESVELLEGVEVEAVAGPLDITCTASDCLRAVAGAKATHVMRTEIEARDGDYDLRLSLIEIATGAVVASAAGGCDLCTDADISEMVTRTATRLRDPILALHDQPAVLVVNGLPAEAEVSIDGEVVGTAPLQQSVEPGRHQLVVAAPGHESQSQAWVAESGTTFEFDYELRVLERSKSKRGMRVAGWTLFGLGLAGIGGGAGLTALHNRPHKPSCPGGETDPNGRCPDMYDTLGPGIGVMGAGLLVAAAGATLVAIDAKRRRAHVAWSPRSVTFHLAF